MNRRSYYVYIMASPSGVLYIGVTNNIVRRVNEHKNRTIQGFTSRYNVTLLVHCEETPDIRDAIEREKQLKGWTRARKVALIESTNPCHPERSEGSSLWLRGLRASTT
jgi:putative endonuclease